MTGRPRLAPGQTGAVSFTTTGSGTHRARIYVRDADGVRREVTATGKTRGAADRALQAKLQKRQAPTAMGVTANMTISELCTFFLDYRLKQATTKSKEDAASRSRRKRRRQRSVTPQTVGAYAAAVRTRIDPLLGELRIQELTVGRLDSVLTSLEYTGVSTAQMRSVLSQALGLAVRHGAIAVNPMTMVTPLPREDNEVEALDLTEVALLRHLVRPEVQGTPGRRKPNRDLCEYVDVALGTGARISEVLALRWEHLDLDSEVPTVLISGTLVEPRKGYVGSLHRQEHTKSGDVRVVILPEPVAELLRARRARVKHTDDSDPVFATRTRNWVWPNTLRTRLRSAIEGTVLEGTTPHSLRRTVGTTIAHKLGLDTAREQLGHAHPGVTGRYYVARMAIAPDCRAVLAPFFFTSEETVAA